MADNPIGRLNEYATKQSTRVRDEYSHSGPDHNRKFVCTMTMGDKVSRGEGKSKKDAKVQAAQIMLQQIPQEKSPPIPKNVSISPRGAGSSGGGGMESTDGSLGATPVGNFKGNLQELCQKNQLRIPEYNTISKSGPSHKFSFSVVCIVKDVNGDIIQRVHGNGTSKKQAENDAAIEMKRIIDALIPDLVNGIKPAATKSILNSSGKVSRPVIPLEDQVHLDELYVAVMSMGFEPPQFMLQTSDPADPKDLTTMKHLCLALAHHSRPSLVECSYDLQSLPVAAQAIGNTEEEAKREALLNLVNNINLLEIKPV